MSVRVAVLYGGVSPERDVSLVTGRAVLEGLSTGPDFEAFGVEILPSGLWSIRGEPPRRAPVAAARLRDDGTDVVFPGLHGPGGEDGVLQGLLELSGLPYVGSGVTASAIAMDKPRARDVVGACGLRMPRALEISGSDPDHAAAQVLSALGLPAVVKDPLGGSSLGVTVADTEEALLPALSDLLSTPARRVLVEEHVRGREFTCAVAGNASASGPLTAFPPLYVKPLKTAWLSYSTKYDPEALAKVAPRDRDAAVLARVRDAALTVHRVLRCDGLTRTDFLVPEDGVPRFLEINTLPGLTPTSLCPAAAELAGLGFADLLGLLVNMALERRGRPSDEESP